LTSIVSIIFLSLIEAAAPNHQLVFTSGTTIVIRKAPSQIVVGADSMTRESGNGAVSFSECKIRQVGDDFLAMGGNIREKVTGFDAFKIATQAMRDSDKPIDKVKGFERNILTPLTEVIRMVRSKNPEYFENRLRDKIVLFVAFFGIEQQSLYLYVRSYKATAYNSIDVKVEPEGSTDCLTGCNTILALGETDAITDYLNTNPKPVLSVELVRKLVQVEIEQTPEYVGPPIDIVRLDTNGANWVDVKPECK